MLILGSAVSGSFGTATFAQDEAIEEALVTGGKVQGSLSDTPGVTQFLGIPFAGNVGGENRWKPAPPVKPWDGVLVADKWGDQMLQDPNKLSDAPISDNGLNLAIWTPAHSSSDRLPVYMLIHGGANRLGANGMKDLYAAQLAAKGVVVVSVQYRLGAPAWLSLPEMAKASSAGPKGNFGVLDLVDALKWIQKNVQAFGGDPATVTIGGQSAGGENTVALLRTPLAKGLFKRAFIQSSFTGFLPGKTVDFAQKSKQNQEAVNKIFGKEMTLADLRAVESKVWLDKWQSGKETLFGVMAGAVATNQFYTIDDYVFTKDSVNLLQPGDFDGLDVIIGQTADEYTGLRPNDLKMTDEEQHKAMLAAIRPYQAGNVDENVFSLYATDDPVEAYRLSLRMLNDYMFEYVRIGAEYAKAHSNANVYLYYWDHWPPGKDQGFRRAWHAGDNWYFNSSLRLGNRDQLPWTDPDIAMRDISVSYLANFIKSGDPNGHNVPHWGQVTPKSGGQFLRFHEGEASMRTSTLYPSRDRYLREEVLKGIGMTEDQVRGRN
ncbi:carboxylesterase family protein [Agrobacterium vitis]|uniref:Carboxylic ester hydrolase n=1 Tax=Agrobacterium vitis TaxID=373 RepID=A0AAE2RAI3_AGRVI|nr:carboxylesterase family protein [Agrobacterium vitis]MBF2714089.1 carboxylesterase family protein [Agrobacterium vitis]MUO82410.1 carboxylesterase family protein [Agrobacterium vitis]MUO95885.1 carboxylesterase family protein [Agrobacterium vitis]MVA93964.1 carboxylesterase family protein [Agrobacterium vitis]MVB03529.1 carboxylesterase family protein [Agrobacterium vitis]